MIILLHKVQHLISDKSLFILQSHTITSFLRLEEIHPLSFKSNTKMEGRGEEDSGGWEEERTEIYYGRHLISKD
jgi:hypothetical protein